MAEYKSALVENNAELQAILDAIEELPDYIDTTDATAAAGDIRSGKSAYVNGVKVEGSVVERSEDDLTASGATVNVPAGIYDSAVSKSVAEVEQATPAIEIDSAGKITSSAVQSAGYVATGTKSATKQLTTKAADTITPGTNDQTIEAETYLTGAQTIKGDANLLPENIAEGVSIFGITGTHAGGGGGGASVESELSTGTITGATTFIAAPGAKTYYYNLEDIPNYSTKKIIILQITTNYVSAILTRADVNDSWDLNSYTTSAGSAENYTVDGNIFSLEGTINTLNYTAV